MTDYWLTCPKCGSRMVERVNGQTGEPFLGCSHWPTCLFTHPLPEHVKLRRLGATSLPGFD